MALLALLAFPCLAEPAVPAMVLVGAPMRSRAIDLSESQWNSLLDRDWETVAAWDRSAVPEPARGDVAFLQAYGLYELGRPSEALPILDELTGSANAPSAWRLWLTAEVLAASGDEAVASEVLAELPELSTVAGRRARLLAGRLAERAGDLEGARHHYEALANDRVSSPDAAEALLALSAIDPDRAAAYLRQVWWAYPRSPAAVEAVRRLGELPTAPEATWQEVGRRAERLMELGQYDAAIAETGRRLPDAEGDETEDGCRFAYARGRSFFKKNQLQNTVVALNGIGRRCAGQPGEYGPRGLFLQGTAESKRGGHTEASLRFKELARLYPEHSMADDALLLGGIELMELELADEARSLWGLAWERYPEGDSTPEALWRLAWSHYLEGDAVSAREHARALGALPLGADAETVAAGRYWAARWLLYPDVANPSSEVSSERSAAIEEWTSLCTDRPQSFYAILAYSRLAELAPEQALSLATRPADRDRASPDRPWVVRLDLMQDPAFRAGVDLMRLGLPDAAWEEWSARGLSDLIPEEQAWVTELRGLGGDWLLAHDATRTYLKTHPPGTLGDGTPEILRVAYPDRYWDEVQVASAGDAYEPRLFHALVREESNFNRTIVSHAGAIGLSQLMPQTADQTAGWLGMTVSRAELEDPATNLKIGAHYLDRLTRSHDGSPFLTLAAYNAGAGRVRSWLAAWGNVPTDEYCERIPFKETRQYVRRVMGSWQLMRFEFDDGPAFPDLSKFNRQAQPDAQETP